MITDEMVRAMRHAEQSFIRAAFKTGIWSEDKHKRALAEAVAPMIRAAALEEAAVEVEEWQVYFKHSGERASGEIAAAIRSLKEPT